MPNKHDTPRFRHHSVQTPAGRHSGNAATYLKIRLKKALTNSLEDITPPFLWKLIIPQTRRKGLPKAFLTDEAGNPFEVADSGPGPLAYKKGLPLIRIPIERLRYQGGMKFNSNQHHFVRYLENGPGALEDYYSRHQPTNIFEKHFLPSPRRKNLPDGGWPWLAIGENTYAVEDSGEKGLSGKHGHQHYGPVSSEKLALEASHLDRLLRSIHNNGYQPTKGYPTGYFMWDNRNDWTFFIRDGQHRIAVLAYLGHGHVVVRAQSNFLTIVDNDHVSDWPMVANGLVSPCEAQKIFRAYTAQDRTLPLYDKSGRKR